jgi:hypothetical protein
LSTAAGLLHVGRVVLTDYLGEHPCLQEFIQNIREELTDDCQAALGDGVDASAPWAVKYTLRTIGGNRGYVEGANRLPIPGKPSAVADPGRSTPENSDDPAKMEQRSQLLARLPEAVVAEALEQTNGHLTRTAQMLGVPRADVRIVIGLRPSLQMAVFQEREKLVDRAELALRRAVKAKRPWAILFVLNTLGRDRGFGRSSRTAPKVVLAPAAVLEPEQIAAPAESPNQTPAASEKQPLAVSATAGLAVDAANQPVDQTPRLLGASAPTSKEESPDVLSKIADELRITPRRPAEVARNAPCPCKSGRKYKRCCGR